MIDPNIPPPTVVPVVNVELISGWRKLWRTYVIQIAALGLALPEVLQMIQDNLNTMDWLDDQWKNGIRIACLAGVILLRPIKQKSLAGVEEIKP